MCAIVDANVARGVFTEIGSAASHFMDQVKDKKIKIVVGGQKLKKEYEKAGMSRWLNEARNAGQVRFEKDEIVDDRAEELALQHEGGITRVRSDDYHILGLAQVSRARLLYSSDRDLHDDFTNKELIDNPRGKVYSTSVDEDLADKHRSLLRQRRCPR